MRDLDGESKEDTRKRKGRWPGRGQRQEERRELHERQSRASQTVLVPLRAIASMWPTRRMVAPLPGTGVLEGGSILRRRGNRSVWDT